MEDGIRNFSDEFLRLLYSSFQAAWADQKPGLRLSFDLFVQRLKEKLNINDQASLISVRNQKIDGFILHTLNYYKGQFSAYNGGTGVVPESRGHGLTKQLYEALIPRLKKQDVKKVILEAVKKNKQAIHVYKDIGFEVTQEFSCYAKRGYFYSEKELDIDVKETINPEYAKFWDSEPSFLDQPQQLEYNLRNEVILESKQGDKITGYIIFQPLLGRISQLAVNPEFRKQGVGKSLIYKAFQQSLMPHMTIMNISKTNSPFNNFLKHTGFVNEIDQYEMELTIK
ncbi:MAG: GNAT family N-acetyltransferase [Bacteroidota bacterium]